MPVDMAIVGSFARLRSSHFTFNRFGLGFLVSGVLTATTTYHIEPYASITLFSDYFSRKASCEVVPRSTYPCREDQVDTVNDTVIRGGVKVPLREGYHILAEFEINHETVVGLALNVIF